MKKILGLSLALGLIFAAAQSAASFEKADPGGGGVVPTKVADPGGGGVVPPDGVAPGDRI